jgi:hypothetical protein
MGKDEVQMMISLQDQSAMLREAKYEIQNNGALKEFHTKIDKFLSERTAPKKV